MPSSRRQRSKNENTFLEHVKECLERLSQEILEVKSMLVLQCPQYDPSNGPFDFCSKPPPAPPMLDIFSRDQLLKLRRGFSQTPIVDGVDVLPKTACVESRSVHMDEEDANHGNFPFAFDSNAPEFSPLGACVDYNSMCFSLEEEDLEESFAVHVKKEVDSNQEMIRAGIVQAQHEARACRFREHWATYRIQSFWRACKSKLKLNGTLFRSCDKESSATAGTYFSDLITSISSPVVANALHAELMGLKLTVSTSYYEDAHFCEKPVGVDGVPKYLKHKVNRRSEYVDFPALEPGTHEFLMEILRMAEDVPAHKKNVFIYTAVEGMAERHNLAHTTYTQLIKFLEHLLECSRWEVMPYTCQACGKTFEILKQICTRCNSNDIFDIRDWMTEGSGYSSESFEEGDLTES